MGSPLKNWLRLNSELSKLPEHEVRALLTKELSDGKRPTYVVRLHARLCQIRMKRERTELLSKCEARRTVSEKKYSGRRLRNTRNKR